MKKIICYSLVISFAALTAHCSLRRDGGTVSGSSPNFGKTRPPIFLEYTINKSVDPGVAANVLIKGRPLTDVQKFRLLARVPAGITVVSGQVSVESANLAADTPLTTSFAVKSDAVGTYYIALDGAFVKDGQNVSDTISIPFVVGDGGVVQKPGNIKETRGEKIIEMPAK
ncbi:MAG: hypothetical protein JSR44_08365 [Spirochaetes bacterium]|nr:hypothetical protein [Spirochaetota bacterium]